MFLNSELISVERIHVITEKGSEMPNPRYSSFKDVWRQVEETKPPSLLQRAHLITLRIQFHRADS